MAHTYEARIRQNGPGFGWYWEVVTEDREVIARGATATHAQACVDSERAARTLSVSGER